ncbi:hypothetical protein OC834_007308 [Tilletia horrida]|nr:hypothetical protein OC834_007308 [Tilletia horrida]
MRLHALLLLASILSVAQALTTGPYGVGDGAYVGSDDPRLEQTQGVAVNAINTTRVCDVSGDVTAQGVTFQLLSALYFPNRANTSTQALQGLYFTSLGMPAQITDALVKQGHTSFFLSNLTANDIVTLKTGSKTDSHAEPGPRTFSQASIPIRAGVPYTIFPLVTKDYAFYTVNASSPPITTSTTAAFFRSAFSFNLFSSVHVSCAAPVREPAAGWTNFVNIPRYGGTGAPLSFSKLYTNDPVARFPPAQLTTAVSSYTPSCSFTGIGKQTMQVSLAGLKANGLVSSSKPIVFKQGQANINITSGIASFLRSSHPTATKVSVKLTTFQVAVSNASPATTNLVPSSGYTSAVYSLSTSGAATASLPRGAPASTFPDATFTPTSPGTRATAVLSQGVVAGTINLFNSASSLVAAVPFRCDEGTNRPAVLPYEIA